MAKSLLQTSTWAQFKQINGWEPIKISSVSVLVRSLPLGLSMAYAPEVSGLDWKNWFPDFTKEITSYASDHNLTFARLEINEPIENQEIIDYLRKNNYHKSFEEVQPEHRQIIDIKGLEQDILAAMKSKGRYNIA